MFKYIFSLIFISITFLSAQVVVETTSKKVEGVGIGLSRTEAVNNALVEALSQLNGVYIKQEKFISDTSIETSKGDYSEFVYNNIINRITKGKLDSYSIDEVNELDGKYEARVSVVKTTTTKNYKTPGLNPKNRRSIIVVPANFQLNSFFVVDRNELGMTVNSNLSSELLNSITQTRKFTVLDREETRAYYNEKKVLSSEDAQLDEALRLGQVLGADYILLTSIKDLNISLDNAQSKLVVNVNNTKSFTTRATIQYKVILMATRQVKFANTKTFIIKPSGETRKEVYYDSLKQISTQISSELISNIYPIKVVDTSNGNITLNQGNLPLGTKYEVFKLGKKIIDSYTKESLGRAEAKIGEIEVVRSLPKYSVAKIISGKATKGSIVRSVISSTNSVQEYNNIGRESDATIGKKGGVILPFD